MYNRIVNIDELSRPDHHFLTDQDHCYYLGEYTAREGWGYSETNKLILNLKKSVDKRGAPEYKYKENAIRSIASCLNKLISVSDAKNFTFVPVPPSKAPSDPLYDNRITAILNAFSTLNSGVDYQEVITQNRSMQADHSSEGNRASIQDLMQNYLVSQAKLDRCRETIVIFDDILTTGRHYKAVKGVIENVADPNRFKILGLFVARRRPVSFSPLIDFESAL